MTGRNTTDARRRGAPMKMQMMSAGPSSDKIEDDEDDDLSEPPAPRAPMLAGLRPELTRSTVPPRTQVSSTPKRRRSITESIELDAKIVAAQRDLEEAGKPHRAVDVARAIGLDKTEASLHAATIRVAKALRRVGVERVRGVPKAAAPAPEPAVRAEKSAPQAPKVALTFTPPTELELEKARACFLAELTKVIAGNEQLRTAAILLAIASVR